MFRNWVFQNFPFLEDDFDALTDYELFCKMMEYVKNFAKDNEEFKKQLEEYENYFENLDVQDEVDNKLDEMAESGQLTEIITEYLQIKGILAYNTVNDMKLSDNLVDGTFTKTYGKNTLLDGLGRFYKVRQLQNTDVIDEINIIALNNPNLIAELIPENYLDDINEINEQIISSNKPIGMKKVIFIGDSYASRSDNWVTPLINKLELSSNDYYIGALGSTGFCSIYDNKTWITLLQDIVTTLTTSEKENITHVIVCGGANDNTFTENEIDTAINNFVTYVNNNLINAKTLIGEIGWTSQASKILDYAKVVDVYSNCGKYNRCYYLNNVQYTLHNYNLLLSDGVHPTVNGNIQLASNIHQAIMTGSCNVIYGQLRHKLNPNDNLKNFYESLNNNIASVYNNRTSVVTVNVVSISADGMNRIALTENIFEYVKGNYFETNRTFITAYINVNGTTRAIPSLIGVYEGILYLYPISLNSSGVVETLTNITTINIPQFKIIMDSLQC